jgi:hypothetical protein
VQDLASQASCLAQALTKRKYDKTHIPSAFKVGDAFLLHVVPANRLLPYFAGPYRVTRVVGDGNTIFGRWLVEPPPPEEGPFHVSRLLPFDASTTDARDTALFHLESGSGVVERVRLHRQLPDGRYELEIKWLSADPVYTWVPLEYVSRVEVVREYCMRFQIEIPVRPEKIPKKKK